MNICLIGYGYWGKILYQNLNKLGIKNIHIIDETLNNLDTISENFDLFFICTPLSTHYNIVENISNYKNKKIWCEKLLTDTYEKTLKIYELIEKNNNKLFVDWTYTFNPIIDRVKELIKNKKIKQIILNRTNDGPRRYDSTSIQDLSVHDLSIIHSLFETNNFEFIFNEFSLNNVEEFGSSLNWSYDDGVQIIINSSWQHKNKNRISIFITEDDEIIIMDDQRKKIIYNNKTENFNNKISPLENAINFFMKNSDFEQNKNITLKIMKNLTDYYENKI